MRASALVIALVLVSSCKAKDPPATGTPTTARHAVRGTVQGLRFGHAVRMELNGSETVDARTDGPFRFATDGAEGAAYRVDVRPLATDDVCTPESTTGVMGQADAVVAVHCGERPRPDLMVESLVGPDVATAWLAGSTVTVEFNVRNQGAADVAATSDALLEVLDATGTSVDHVAGEVEPLRVGQSTHVSMDIRLPDVSERTFVFLAVDVTPRSAVSDGNPADNGATWGSLQVVPAARIQVRVTGLPAGQQLQLQAASQEAAPQVVSAAQDGAVEFPSPWAADREVSVQVVAQPQAARCVRHALRTLPGEGPLAEFSCTAGAGTRGNLRWSEVAQCPNAHAACWAEVYNDSDDTADLAAYAVRVPAVSWDPAHTPRGTQAFVLPPLTVPAHGYAVVQAATSLVHESTLRGFFGTPLSEQATWGTDDSLELLDADGNLLDAVRFGASAGTTMGWSGPGVVVTDAAVRTWVRLPGAADTDRAEDWQPAWFATPGGPNDVRCAEDADEDGLPDCAEVPGSTCAGMDLHAWGARVGQRDIFIELDHVENVSDHLQPPEASINHILDVFHRRGFFPHFDVGDAFDSAPAPNPARHNLGGGGAVPASNFTQLFDSGGTDDLPRVKEAHMDPRRVPYFHYAMEVRLVGCTLPASGCGEIGGNDFMVAADTAFTGNELINRLSSLWMHELGHNLGLHHGGDDETNYKPNYLSIMNYLYAPGLPDPVQQPGDRFYSQVTDNAACMVPLLHGLSVEPADFLLDYSDGSSAPINEAAVVEAAGLGRPGNEPVDFNCNGTTDATPYAANLIGHGVPGEDRVLHDFDDWNHLMLAFDRVPAAPLPPFPGGAPRRNVMLADRQPVAP